MTVGHGLDISEWQGAVDYAALLAAHPEIVGIRASFGSNGTDGRFALNRDGLSGKTPLTILYHFAYPNLNSGTAGAQLEANHFCDVVGPLRPGEQAALDWETPYSGDQVAWSEAWWTVVEQRLGVQRPDEWDYGSASTLWGLRSDSLNALRHLWIAVYPTGGGDPNSPPAPAAGFSHVDIWQHGGGNWPGVSGSVDDDWVYDTALAQNTGGTVTTPYSGTINPDTRFVWRAIVDLMFFVALQRQSTGADDDFYCQDAINRGAGLYEFEMDSMLGADPTIGPVFRDAFAALGQLANGAIPAVLQPALLSLIDAEVAKAVPGAVQAYLAANPPASSGVSASHTHAVNLTIDGVSVPATTGTAQ